MEERLGGLPCYFVRTQCPLRALKSLLRELLHVCLTGRVIHDSIVVSALRLRGLEALDQRLGEVEGVVVSGVEALADDLVDGMVFA